MKRELVALVLLGAVFASPTLFARADGSISVTQKVAMQQPQRRIPKVLMYHDVMDIQAGTDAMRQIIAIRPEHLEEQFKYLHENRYDSIFASDFVGLLGKPFPPKTVVITFDDGLRDVYDTVLPLIRKYGIKITVFANPGFDGTNGRMSHAELWELSNSGLVEIGAHTMDHVNLTEVTDDEARIQIRDSKALLEEITGKPVKVFAYPFGKFGYREEKMVAEFGMSTAFAADDVHGKHHKNRLRLPRVTIGEKTSAREFIRIVRGW